MDLLLDSTGFTQEKSLSQVSSRLLCNLFGQFWRQGEAFLPTDLLKYSTHLGGEREREGGGGGDLSLSSTNHKSAAHLFNLRGSHSHSKATTAYGWDDLTGGVTAEDDATSGHVLLHGSPQSMLSISRQLIHLCQHHNYSMYEKKN